MSENENTLTEGAQPAESAGAQGGESTPQPESVDQAATPSTPPPPSEEISYHAVERDGQVTAIWEMQGRKHLRTIDPRSHQGQEILRLYTSDHHDEIPAPGAAPADAPVATTEAAPEGSEVASAEAV